MIEHVLEDQTDTANTPVRPVVSYTMEKRRITEARPVGDKYGFTKGDTVTYQVTINNTGTLALTMNVADAFENPSYFTTPSYTKVEGEGVESNHTLPSTEKANITVEPGKTAIVTIQSKVLTDTEYLASTAADDKINGKDGYVNTAKVTDVTGEYIIKDKDGEDITNILDKNNNKELEDKTDTANTPVRAASVAAGGDPKVNKTAKTGDETNLSFWLLILCLAGAEITMLLRKRKRVK